MKHLIFIFLIVSHLTWAQESAAPIELRAIEQTLIVNGKPAKVFNIVQPDGTEGYTGFKGGYFNVTLKNNTSVPISVHWHGLILPNEQDGVPYVTQLPIPPGKSHHYYFKLLQAGTYWMHSHFRFHEQELMTAPLILKDPDEHDKSDKEIVLMLQGFTFKNPKAIFYDLQHTKKPMKIMSAKPDLNDIHFDAYLANRHTLRHPQIYEVAPNTKIRLRIINGSTASNFWVDTGKLQAKAIAVDGNNIHPIANTRFQIGVAQRIDLMVEIPKTGGAFPILAQVEGTNQQTGIILATQQAKIPKFPEHANTIAPALNNAQELKIHPLNSIEKKAVQASLKYILTGNMKKYIWKINNEVWPHITPYKIKQGYRIEMVYVNETGMSHPMHFHGHVFQVTEINGKLLENGPLRDTILVLPHSSQKIVFDATNPGIWMNHCHILYHMVAGMMTTTNYLNYPEPDYYRDLVNNSAPDEAKAEPAKKNYVPGLH